MKAQAQKDQLIADLTATRRQIEAELSALPVEKHSQVFLGFWSILDLCAHFIGWDITNLRAGQQVLAGELPDFYQYHDRDWQTYNARLVHQYRRDDLAALLVEMRRSHQDLVDWAQDLPAEEYAKDRGVRFRGYRVTITRLLQAELEDERKHLEQIKALATSAPLQHLAG
jgi:hypothetical protein